MRIQTKDLAGERTEKLHELVPLPAPWTMYIDVTNRCNFKCVYCPTGNPDMLSRASRVQKDMPFGLFRDLVEDMRKFPQRVKIVNLYKDGDPLMNRSIVKMVHILRNADVTEKIYTKTNGELIPFFKDLADAPLDMLGISVPHVYGDKFLDVVGKAVDYDKYVAGIRDLFNDPRRRFSINAKMARYNMTDDDVEKFYTDFEPICDTVALEGLHGWGAASVKDMFLEDIGTHDGVPFSYKLVCPLPMYMMSVSSNGVTNVCCAEWGNFHNLGNAYDTSLLELWNNDKRRDFQIMHLEGRRFENIACADCQYRDNLPDNIDQYAADMLERMEKLK